MVIQVIVMADILRKVFAGSTNIGREVIEQGLETSTARDIN
jgi:hypothetical protein